MTKNMRWMTGALGSVTIMVSACGGGGIDELDGPAPVPLTTKADALRELSMNSEMMFALEGVLSEFHSIAPGVAPKALDGEQICDAGQSVLQTGSGTFRYSFFDRMAETPFERITETQCKQLVNNGSLLVTYNGVTETGRSTTQADDSQLAYVLIGSDGSSYEKKYEERNASNVTVGTSLERLYARSEARTAEAAVEIRSVALYEYSDDRSGYSARIAVGDLAQPLILAYTNAGGHRRSGSYSYSSSTCAGGFVTISTPQELLIGESLVPGRITGGQLKFVSGEKSATFMFNNDGSATLQVGGQTLSLTTDEVETALYDEPC